MKNKIFIVVLLISCLGCFEASKKENIKFTKVNFIYTLPVKLSSVLVDTTPIIFRIIYSGNKVMYELPYRESFSTDGQIQSDTTKYEFFAYLKHDKFGYLVKDLKDPLTKKLEVDTILGERAFKTLDLYNFLSTATLSRSYTDPYNRLVNVYSFKDNFLDSGYYFFNKGLQGIDFSLSKKLDSLFDSKLFKVELLSKRDTSQNAEYLNKFRIIRFEIDTIPVSNEKGLIDFFDRYRS